MAGWLQNSSTLSGVQSCTHACTHKWTVRKCNASTSLQQPSHWRRPCRHPRTIWLRWINTDEQLVNIGIHSALDKDQRPRALATYHRQGNTVSRGTPLKKKDKDSNSLVLCSSWFATVPKIPQSKKPLKNTQAGLFCNTHFPILFKYSAQAVKATRINSTPSNSKTWRSNRNVTANTMKSIWNSSWLIKYCISVSNRCISPQICQQHNSTHH